MNDEVQGPANEARAKKSNVVGRFWRWLWKPSPYRSIGYITVIGVVLGILAWGGFNWALEITNTETFCVSCHEMERNVYREYRNTVHYNNRTGVRASCPDCHVPKEWIHKVRRKVRASNELWHHVLGTIDTREKFEAKRLQLARNEWARMKRTDSRECRNCHNFEFMDLTKQENRSADRHQEGIKEGQTCIDCHKGIAHELPAGAYEAESGLSRSEPGYPRS
jgi:cytochrome c-type protein NapC